MPGLLGLGFRPNEARSAVELAITRAGGGATLEQVVFQALRLSHKAATG